MHIQHIINEASETCDKINEVFEKIKQCGKMEDKMLNEAYEERLKEYRAILKRADFFYRYADGQAYNSGRESYWNAASFRKLMLEDFPEAEKEIDALWVRHGGKV